jgi:hypothetical protein
MTFFDIPDGTTPKPAWCPIPGERHPRQLTAIAMGWLFLLLSGCQGGTPVITPIGGETLSQAVIVSATASPFAESPTASEPDMSEIETTLPPAATITLAWTSSPIPFGSCTDGLVFMGDLTYPDRSRVQPGQSLEKRWKVRNSGTCDWGPDYSFRWIGGTPLSSREEFALYPAVSGSEAVIAVLLTAPSAAGEYIFNWRAFSPTGTGFGDILYIDIVVST